MFVPAPGVVALELVYNFDNQPCENTWHYHVTGAIDQAKLVAMQTTLFVWASAHVALWPDNVRVLKSYARDLTAEDSFTQEGTPAIGITGTNATGALPNSCTFALKRDSGRAGRANRGRLYWIGISHDNLADDNHVAVGYANGRRDALNTLMTAQVTDNAAQEVILHRKLGTYTPILGYTYTDLTIDNQRRRLPDHNRHR